MLGNGCRGVAIPEPYFKYRVRSVSMFHSTTENVKIWTYQQLAQKHSALYALYAEDIINLINTNGPGYLYDNPTHWYPLVGFLPKSSPPTIAAPPTSDLQPSSARAYLYLALRAAFLKPSENFRKRLPWLEKIRLRVKKFLIRDS